MGPRFARFAAAMDEARATGAPQLGLYVHPTVGVTAQRPEGPPPRLARRRTTLRWIGIGSCVLVVGVLLASWLVGPQPAQLLGRWLATGESGAVARAATVLSGSPPAGKRAAADS
jgi:hypothetical protein